jgi:AcrR family transcriptional regulator
MTKGSLYYYFPDKENLYMAVVEKEQAEFIRVLHEDLKNISDPVEGLRKYVINRLSYFKTLVNLSRMRAESLTQLKPIIADSMIRFREHEKLFVKDLLDKGQAAGVFRIADTRETASLFLDLLRGLRGALLNDKKLLIIEDDEYRLMADKAIRFTDIFINGLRNR